MSVNKEAFEKWLDGKAVDSQDKENWQQDAQLNADFETSLWLKHQAECFAQQPVPEWDREATFGFTRPKQDWFSWLRVSPGLSMAVSVTALLMVLFRVEFHFSDEGFLLAFGADRSQQLEKVMDEKLRTLGRDQQIIMANYVDDIQTRQNTEITRLASYLINAGRQERQEDLSALVSFLKAQRQDDISLQQQQFDNIMFNLKPSTGERAKRRSYKPAAMFFRHQAEQGTAGSLSNKEEK